MVLEIGSGSGVGVFETLTLIIFSFYLLISVKYWFKSIFITGFGTSGIPLILGVTFPPRYLFDPNYFLIFYSSVLIRA